MDTIEDKVDEEIKVLHRYTILYDLETEESEVFYETEPEYLDIAEALKEITNTTNNNPEESDFMATINLMFPSVSVNFGTITKGEKVKIVFPFTGSSDIIEAVKPNCGCTAEVNINEEDKQIEAMFDSTGQEGALTKNIIVYYKDGLPLKIRSKSGAKITNPKKNKTLLSFTGKVVPSLPS